MEDPWGDNESIFPQDKQEKFITERYVEKLESNSNEAKRKQLVPAAFNARHCWSRAR